MVHPLKVNILQINSLVRLIIPTNGAESLKHSELTGSTLKKKKIGLYLYFFLPNSRGFLYIYLILAPFPNDFVTGKYRNPQFMSYLGERIQPRDQLVL